MNENEKYKNKLSGVGIRIIETGEIFETRQKCASRLGVSASMITYYFNHKISSCGGFHLEYVETDFECHLTEKRIRELNVLVQDTCIWKEHPYISNVYVSNTGVIAKNVRGNIKILRKHIQNSGYYVVSVGDYRTSESMNHNQLVHRLVAETYLINRNRLQYVNHIDGNKLNNNVNNLEWVSPGENNFHAYKTGLKRTEPICVVETGEVFRSASECARAIGGTASGIHDYKCGIQNVHRGFHFKFGVRTDKFDDCYYSILLYDIWTGECAYFDSVLEATQITGFSRSDIVNSLLNESVIHDHYIMYYAGEEEVLLYGDDDYKLLSWIRVGLR